MKTEAFSKLLKYLELAPIEVGNIFQMFPKEKVDWRPKSWEGVPSEKFSALGQICHLRDFDTDGYQIRLQRVVRENYPFLPSIDGYELEKKREYHLQDADLILAQFRLAREKTIEMLKSFSESDLQRKGVFEGYGEVTLIGLMYFLRSHDLQHLSGLSWLLGKLEAAS